ncbi:hypothetical protein GCM10020216_005540 [Nonomuraea helvata]
MHRMRRLERDQATLRVFGQIHHSHPARAEAAEEQVPADDDRVAHRKRSHARRHVTRTTRHPVSPLLIRDTAKHTVAGSAEAFRMSVIRGIGGKAAVPTG